MRDRTLVPTVMWSDFSMCGVTVLQNEHSIIAFELMKNDDNVPISIVSVYVHSQGFEVLKHISRTVRSVGEMSDVDLIVL